MSITSSRSARVIRREEAVAVTSGIPLTDPSSETSSGTYTEWIVQLTDEKRYIVKIPGLNGRITYGRSPSRSGAEVRFYRTQTAKSYAAVIPEVFSISASDVTIELAPKSTEERASELARETILKEMEKDRMEKVAEAIVARTYLDPGGPPF